jgi:hypothetical protein
LHEAWFTFLKSTPQRRILEALLTAYPESIDKEELASIVGASFTSSSYVNNLGRLRSLGLIDYPGSRRVVATSLLFIEGLR